MTLLVLFAFAIAAALLLSAVYAAGRLLAVALLRVAPPAGPSPEVTELLEELARDDAATA